MKIVGFLKESFQDWDAGLSSVVFTSDCNFNCPSCYASELRTNSIYSDKKVLNYLGYRKKRVPRVVLCGGEPTCQWDIVNFIIELKKQGLAVKLDTNGSDPSVLCELRDKKLVDYVAMDVKGPPTLYSKVVGKHIDLRDDVEKGMMVVTQFPDYEFRTTIVPIVRD